MPDIETDFPSKNYWELYEKETNEKLNILKNLIKINNDPGITKYPQKNGNGDVIFGYKNMGRNWEIITKKEGNKYKVKIKKFKDRQRNTQKIGNRETFDFNATDKGTFNRRLGVVLDRVIGRERDRLPTTGGRVYDLLNVDNQKDTLVNNREKKDPNKMPEGLRMENGVYVYRIQPGDTRSGLISKLSVFKPLSYLRDGYGWKGASAKSFNVGEYLPDSKFQAGVDIIVPNEKYIKTVSEFRNAQLAAIEKMKRNTTYGDKVKKLFKSRREGGFGLSERQVANVMTAFARSESSNEALNDKIGECALFRYEPSQVFSYGYHHVLKYGAGEKAFGGLDFTVGDACDPMKSGMLFIAYCIEKSPNDYQKFFDLDNNLAWGCENYNGRYRRQTNPNYDRKLKNNYNYVKGVR